MQVVPLHYGTAWGSPEELQAYNKFKLEAARRDHRKLGKELNLVGLYKLNAVDP
jgi:threonyl-tRNA synthetase